VNKNTQIPGVTVRFSLKAASINRYYITAEHRSGTVKRDMVTNQNSTMQSYNGHG